MAKVDFNNMQDDSAYSTSGNNNGNDVGFFTLKNDNDEAIVRFMCDSTDDFEILTTHEITVGGKYRKINCIRDFRDPVDNCPLCASGSKINQRFFIKMIQYDKTTDATTGSVHVTPKAVVWERSTAYAKTLKSYLDNYGPLSDIICKVIRHGRAGDMQTTYEIVPNLNKAIYKDEIYVKDASLFGDFNAFGTIVMDRTYDEIMQFQVTGEFPVREKKQEAASAPETYNQPVLTCTHQVAAPSYNTQPETAVPAYQAPTQPVAPAQGGWGQPTPRTQMPWDNAGGQSAGGFERPRRY